MTDKTVIAAVRDKHELALKDLTVRLTECNRLNFCMDELSAFAAFSSTVIDQLEAERQQLEAAEAELAALRGGQEPVAKRIGITPDGDTYEIWLDANRYHYRTDGSASLMMEGMNHSFPRRVKSVTIIAALKAIVGLQEQLFTRQPKPVVVLPKSHYVVGCADKFMSEREVQGAMLAAGIVVKDGE